MNPKTIRQLEYFVNKVCSVFTHPINRTFDEIRSREHFVVQITEVNSDGIWGVHPYNGTVSFFALPHIILITEEVVLDPKNPEHARMIQEYQEKTGETIMSDVSPHLAPIIPAPDKLVSIGGLKQQTPAPTKQEPAFVDIKHLSALAKRTKQGIDIKEQFE